MKILENFINENSRRDYQRNYKPGAYYESADAVLNAEYRIELRRLREGETNLYIRYNGTAVFVRPIDMNKEKRQILDYINRKINDYEELIKY